MIRLSSIVLCLLCSPCWCCSLATSTTAPASSKRRLSNGSDRSYTGNAACPSGDGSLMASTAVDDVTHEVDREVKATHWLLDMQHDREVHRVCKEMEERARDSLMPQLITLVGEWVIGSDSNALDVQCMRGIVKAACEMQEGFCGRRPTVQLAAFLGPGGSCSTSDQIGKHLTQALHSKLHTYVAHLSTMLCLLVAAAPSPNIVLHLQPKPSASAISLVALASQRQRRRGGGGMTQ